MASLLSLLMADCSDTPACHNLNEVRQTFVHSKQTRLAIHVLVLKNLFVTPAACIVDLHLKCLDLDVWHEQYCPRTFSFSLAGGCLYCNSWLSLLLNQHVHRQHAAQAWILHCCDDAIPSYAKNTDKKFYLTGYPFRWGS